MYRLHGLCQLPCRGLRSLLADGCMKARRGVLNQTTQHMRITKQSQASICEKRCSGRKRELRRHAGLPTFSFEWEGQCGDGHDAHPLPELRGYCKWIPRRRRSTSPTDETGSSQGDREISSRSWDVETRIDAGKVSTLVPWTVTVSAPPCAIIARDHPPRWTARPRSPHTTLCGQPAR